MSPDDDMLHGNNLLDSNLPDLYLLELKTFIIMGRIRQQIPKRNFIFKNQANAKGKRILYLRYYVNGIPVMTSTRR